MSKTFDYEIQSGNGSPVQDYHISEMSMFDWAVVTASQQSPSIIGAIVVRLPTVLYYPNLKCWDNANSTTALDFRVRPLTPDEYFTVRGK